MSELRLEHLDLNLVLTLHWLLTEQSVSRAAERLGVSQPAVSHSLKRLRETLHDPLLVKSGRIMRTTPKAERIQPAVARIVQEMREVFQTAASFEPATAQGRLRIAAPDSWAVLAGRAWDAAIRPLAPALQLDVVTLDFPVAQDLVSGAVDLVLLPETKLLDLPPGLDVEQFVQRHVSNETYLCAVGRDHPLAARKRTLADYLAADHIVTNPAGAALGGIDALLAERGLERRVIFRTESFLAGLALARQGMGVLTAPASAITAVPDGLVAFAPPIEVPGFSMLMGWHPNWTVDPRHRWLREHLVAALQALPGPRLSGD
ncbi:LysR family transcriptional regulator [Parvularcula oceani]|uniref:LysR family transcriptional regulator n=1 Tax=Parvularcula oceani TaxID=1247963 RepID=UPI0004E20702|nr:LysR family transcriptional regulator [Parvularcula oceani]